MLCKFTANCTIGGGYKRRICAVCTSTLLAAVILVFAVLALPISVSAEQSGDGWTFDETTGALTITSNDGTTNWRRWDMGNLDWTTAKSVEIKDGVTQIKIGAFSGCINLTSVSLPEGIVSIGNTAFNECSKLTSITLPESLEEIGTSVFADCSSLTSLLIPINIKQYGNNAFRNCTSLKTLFIPDCFDDTTNISISGQTAVINYNLNDGNFNITKIYLNNGMTEVDLPDTIGGKTVNIPKELMKDVTHTHEYSEATCTQKAACTLCGLEYGELKPHDYSEATCTQKAKCAVCGLETGELKPHTGGTASCIAKAVCGVCMQEYGDLAAHTLVKTEASSPTCTAAGNDEYWTCSVCQKMFADGSGTAEITEIPTIAALPHDFVNGFCADCGAPDPTYTPPTETSSTETSSTETESTGTSSTGTSHAETTPAVTEPTGTAPTATAPTSPTGTAPSVPPRPSAPSYPAPAVTTAVTTVTTVTTVAATTAEEEIIGGDYTGEDVSVDAAAYSDGKELGGRALGAALIYITIFAGIAIAVKKLRPVK